MAQSTTKKIRKLIAHKKERIRNWDTNGRCPICKKWFKGDCKHGMGHVTERMEDNLIISVVQTMVREEVAKALADFKQD
jgi:hypothetical protein